MKINRRIKILPVSLILFLAFSTGCYYDQVYVPPVEGDISYSTDIQPYFNASCISCHNGTGVPLNLDTSVSYNELTSGGYINTADPGSSKLYTKIAPGGSMEQYSTPTETAMTLKWIEQGAKNN